MKGSLAASPLIVSTSTPMLFIVSICATQQACGLATPPPLLQSATMSVLRHTARTGSNEPQVSNELAGRQFRIWWIQNRRPGRIARSLENGARRNTRPGQTFWEPDRGRSHFIFSGEGRGGRISRAERRRQIDGDEDHQRLHGAHL